MLSLNNIYIKLKNKNKKVLYVLSLTLILNLCPQTIPTSYASEMSGGGLRNGLWDPYDLDMSQGVSEDRSSRMMDKTLEQQREEAAQKKAKEKAAREAQEAAKNTNNTPNQIPTGSHNSPAPVTNPVKDNIMTKISNDGKALDNTEVKTLGADRDIEEIVVDDTDLESAKDKCLELVRDKDICQDDSLIKKYAQCLKAYDGKETACAFFLDKSSITTSEEASLTEKAYDILKSLATALGYDSVAQMLLYEGGMLALSFVPGLGMGAIIARLAKSAKYANALAKIISKIPKLSKFAEKLKVTQKGTSLEEVTADFISKSKGNYVQKLEDVASTGTKEDGLLSKWFTKGISKDDMIADKADLLRITEQKNAAKEVEQAKSLVEQATKKDYETYLSAQNNLAKADEAQAKVGIYDENLAQETLNKISTTLSNSERFPITNAINTVNDKLMGNKVASSIATNVAVTSVASGYMYAQEKSKESKLNANTSQVENNIAQEKIKSNNAIYEQIKSLQASVNVAKNQGSISDEELQQVQNKINNKQSEIEQANEQIRQTQYTNDTTLKQTTQSYNDYIIKSNAKLH